MENNKLKKTPVKKTGAKKDPKDKSPVTKTLVPEKVELVEKMEMPTDLVIDTPVPQMAPPPEEDPHDSIKDLEVAKKMLKIFQSANDRGLEYDLSFKTVRRLMNYRKCYYTGREFREDGPYSRSFDRVDSTKGYIEGNVVACTVDINQKKSNLSNEEITILYEKLVLKK